MPDHDTTARKFPPSVHPMPIAERELKTRIPNDGGVVVLWGYGLKLRIDRRHLTLEDGAGLERRSARFAKAPAKIKRLVLLSTDGYLSLEVVRWLHDAGASLSILSPDGDVIAAFGPTRLDDGRLRRAQAIAPWTAAGLRIARELLARKVAGQAAVLRAFDLGDDGQRAHVDEAASWLRGSDSTHSIEEFTLAEAIAAGTYWDAWAPITVRYAQKDEPHVPEHWRRFDARMSLVTGRSRRASNPANALLNYLYALLGAETTIALRAYGLDPGLGVVHTDQPARASFACDVMEAGRPEADRIVIELLRSRVFRVRDFIETPDGGCRLTTPIARELAALTMRLGRAIGPAVEQVVRILETTPLEPADGRLPRARVANRKAPALPTFLTQSRRSEGRASIRRAGTERVMIAPRCTSCGKPIASSERTLCDPCLAESKAAAIARLAIAGPNALARARAAGRTHGGETGRKRGWANAAHHRANAAWVATPEEAALDYERDVLPAIADVPLRALQAATGLSLRTVSLARRGRPPHRRHWSGLLEVGLGRTDGRLGRGY